LDHQQLVNPPEVVNPFAGPRPLQSTDPLFGREREVRELSSLLMSQRIVVLHGPSGAGKSSLLDGHHGLIDQLKKSFTVWPKARVNREPKPTTGDQKEIANRFVWSVINDFAGGKEDDAFRNMTLVEYAAGRIEKPTLLIFDQFEEIVRIDPAGEKNRAIKAEFFRQLGELLTNRRIWALLCLREDYLAALDPWKKLLPTYLENRYRIDLLSPENARSAIRETAEQQPGDVQRKFTKEALDHLQKCLSTTREPQGDTWKEVEGGYVEPLQLQVVCKDVWAAAGKAEITLADVEKVDIGQALARYYDEHTRNFENPRAEYRIREWIEHHLISAAGAREQVRYADAISAGVESALVRLIDAHLLHKDKRLGVDWVELSHDQLIGPVKSSNAAWFEDLSEWEKRARSYEWETKESLKTRHLVADEQRAQARAWTERNPNSKVDLSQYLAACDEYQKQVNTERNRSRQLKAGVAIFFVIALVAIYQWMNARSLRNLAQNRSRAQSVSASAKDRLESGKDDDDLRELMMSAWYALQSISIGGTPEAFAVLRDLTLRLPHVMWTADFQGSPQVEFSPEGDTLYVGNGPNLYQISTANGQGSNKIWATLNGDGKEGAQAEKITYVTVSDEAVAVALHSHSSSGSDRVAVLSRSNGGVKPVTIVQLPEAASDIRLSPEGHWLLAYSKGEGWLYEIGGDGTPSQPRRIPMEFQHAVFYDDGFDDDTWLVVSQDRSVTSFRLIAGGRGDVPPPKSETLPDRVTALGVEDDPDSLDPQIVAGCAGGDLFQKPADGSTGFKKKLSFKGVNSLGQIRAGKDGELRLVINWTNDVTSLWGQDKGVFMPLPSFERIDPQGTTGALLIPTGKDKVRLLAVDKGTPRVPTRFRFDDDHGDCQLNSDGWSAVCMNEGKLETLKLEGDKEHPTFRDEQFGSYNKDEDGLAISPTGEYVLVVKKDKIIRLRASTKEEKELRLPHGLVPGTVFASRSFSVDGSGTRIAFENKGTLEYVDTERGTYEKIPELKLSNFQFSFFYGEERDPRLVVIDEILYTVDLKNKKLLNNKKDGVDTYNTDFVSLDKSGKKLLTGRQDGHVRIRLLEDESPIDVYSFPLGTGDVMQDVALDGDRLTGLISNRDSKHTDFYSVILDDDQLVQDTCQKVQSMFDEAFPAPAVCRPLK